MKLQRLLGPVCLGLLLATTIVTARQQAGGPADGWIPLFDGKSLEGWRRYGQADAAGTRWIVEDGMLTLPERDPASKAGAGDLITKETFDRFELVWDWKVSPGGNSGVKYYVVEDRKSAVGHEYQIIDDQRHADAKIGPERQTASLYDVLPPSSRAMKPAGEINTSRIVADGRTVEHYLNGERVLTYELGSPALQAAIKDSKFNDVPRFGTLQNGHILLQDHGDRVWYRNIRVRRLPPAGGASGR